VLERRLTIYSWVVETEHRFSLSSIPKLLSIFSLFSLSLSFSFSSSPLILPRLSLSFFSLFFVSSLSLLSLFLSFFSLYSLLSFFLLSLLSLCLYSSYLFTSSLCISSLFISFSLSPFLSLYIFNSLTITKQQLNNLNLTYVANLLYIKTYKSTDLWQTQDGRSRCRIPRVHLQKSPHNARRRNQKGILAALRPGV
jgi:hypothetical protein